MGVARWGWPGGVVYSIAPAHDLKLEGKQEKTEQKAFNIHAAHIHHNSHSHSLETERGGEEKREEEERGGEVGTEQGTNQGTETCQVIIFLYVYFL